MWRPGSWQCTNTHVTSSHESCCYGGLDVASPHHWQSLLVLLPLVVNPLCCRWCVTLPPSGNQLPPSLEPAYAGQVAAPTGITTQSSLNEKVFKKRVDPVVHGHQYSDHRVLTRPDLTATPDVGADD